MKLLPLLGLGLAAPVFAAVPYDGGEYSQDFNSLGESAVTWTNNAGVTLTEFTLDFDWEKWFVADISVNQNMRISHSTNATSLSAGTYTEVAAAQLTFTGPRPPAGSRVWLETPNVFNRSVIVTGIS